MYRQLAKHIKLGQHIRQFSSETGSAKLWGGRFSKDTNKVAATWADSTEMDKKFGREDIWGSFAHVAMLGRTGVIPHESSAKTLVGLKKLHDNFLDGEWTLKKDREDIHLNVEGELIDRLGMDIAGCMHTTRSRNDQVALDARMMARTHLLPIRKNVVDVIDSFLDKAENAANLKAEELPIPSSILNSESTDTSQKFSCDA